MKYDPDPTLDMVDQWKFKLYNKLKRMTEAEQTAFWKAAEAKARARGLPVYEPESTLQPARKRKRRKTG